MKKTISAAALFATVALSTSAVAEIPEGSTPIGCKAAGEKCAWAPRTEVTQLENGDRATVAYCPEGTKVVKKNFEFCAQPKPAML